MSWADVIGDLFTLGVKSPTPERLIGPEAPHDSSASPHYQCSRIGRAVVRIRVQHKPACGLSVIRDVDGVDADLAMLSRNNEAFAVFEQDVDLLLLIRINALDRILRRQRR